MPQQQCFVSSCCHKSKTLQLTAAVTVPHLSQSVSCWSGKHSCKSKISPTVTCCKSEIGKTVLLFVCHDRLLLLAIEKWVMEGGQFKHSKAWALLGLQCLLDLFVLVACRGTSLSFFAYICITHQIMCSAHKCCTSYRSFVHFFIFILKRTNGVHFLTFISRRTNGWSCKTKISGKVA